MKIILTAFGEKLMGKPMEVPDNTSPDFYLPMPMDVLAPSPRMDGSLVAQIPVMKRGHFRATGRAYVLEDFGVKPAIGEALTALQYTLVDIS